jgi:hypothetical protein
VGDPAVVPTSGSGVSLERSAQTLPVPLGGLSPVHRHSTVLLRGWRRHRTAPLMALALACAGSGVWLSVIPRSFVAGRDAVGVQLDDVTLVPEGPSVAGIQIFTGPATMAITTSLSGIARAGAVMTWNGNPATGRCVLIRIAADASETCDFQIGSTRVTSADHFAARTRTWGRRYSDGVEVSITVPGGSALIPIPFPLGR